MVAQFCKRRRSRRASQARAYHDDGVLTLVGGIDQLHLEAMAAPPLFDWARWYFRIQFHCQGRLRNEPEQDRCRDRDESCHHDHRQDGCQSTNQTIVSRIIDAERLTHTPHAMIKVKREHQHGDDVDDRHVPYAKPTDDVVVNI